MQRRSLLSMGLALAAPAQPAAPPVLESARPGRPRAGQVVVALQPHADDIPLFACGLVLKLIAEGATAHLIRVTNDDMAGPGSYADTVAANARDHAALARALGVAQTFDLNYNNHMMDQVARPELRARLIFLFRLLRADILVGYDPWGRDEENPDHYLSAACAEAAAWMAGGAKDYPEHFAAGLQPHAIREKYYFSRFDNRANRIVDTTPFVDRIIDVNLENRAQGPAGENGRRLRARLAREGRRLPLLGDNDADADRNYIREFVLARERQTGEPHGFAYAEAFHYIGPAANAVEERLRREAVPLK